MIYFHKFYLRGRGVDPNSCTKYITKQINLGGSRPELEGSRPELGGFNPPTPRSVLTLIERCQIGHRLFACETIWYKFRKSVSHSRIGVNFPFARLITLSLFTINDNLLIVA